MTDRIRRHGYTLPADTRLAAWEIVIGEQDLSAARHRKGKAHRGMLPDVDFGAAVRDLERRSLLRRVLERIWPRKHQPLPGPAADLPVSGRSETRVGRTARPSYMRLTDASGDSSAAPDSTAIRRPRAA